MQITATLIIIIATCLVSIPAFSNQKMINDLVFYPARMKGGRQLYRFITHGFIHADFIHLFFNMLTLYFFGPFVELNILGRGNFVLLYFTAMIAASLYDFFKHKDNYYYRSLGASGAVSAVVFAVIIIDPWVRGICPFGICIPNILFAVLYIAYSQYMAKKGADNIGHNAHMWGSIYGFIFTALLRPDLLRGFLDRLIHPPFF